jgi:hypothetical protein
VRSERHSLIEGVGASKNVVPANLRRASMNMRITSTVNFFAICILRLESAACMQTSRNCNRLELRSWCQWPLQTWTSQWIYYGVGQMKDIKSHSKEKPIGPVKTVNGLLILSWPTAGSAT